MNTAIDNSVRETAVYDLAPGMAARAQNFVVQWLESGKTFDASSPHEMMLLLPDGSADVRTSRGTTHVPGGSIAILPADGVSVQVDGTNRGILVASTRTDLTGDAACNANDYAQPDPRLANGDAGYRRTRGAGDVHVIAIDSITPPAGKPRLKIVQSETLSISWSDHPGARDRTKLSPHSHADFEQASLIVEGHFVHHLRVTWGPNANTWRDDQHLPAGPASFIAIPAQMIHTTEGIGDGRHLLIDVFSPPRQDFIDNGYVANSGDYTRNEV